MLSLVNVWFMLLASEASSLQAACIIAGTVSSRSNDMDANPDMIIQEERKEGREQHLMIKNIYLKKKSRKLFSYKINLNAFNLCYIHILEEEAYCLFFSFLSWNKIN